MIPEVRACSGYLVITPKRAYRDNARALMTPRKLCQFMRCHPVHGCQIGSEHTWDERSR
jgi:hypothetical protein